MIPFLSISLVFVKPEISANFFSDKEVFLGFRILLIQFSQVVLFHLSRKRQDEKFLKFFQLFTIFIKMEKMLTFFRFLCLAAVKKWRQMKCSLGLDIFAPFFYSIQVSLKSRIAGNDH